MRTWTIGLVVVVLLIALAPIAAADKPQDLIIGKWQMDANKATITVDFEKDGKVKVSIKEGANETKGSGTYKFINDETMEVMLDIDGEKKNEKLKVKVTKDELITTDESKKEE